MPLFEQKAPSIMVALMRDLGIADFQAGGVLGNFGHETGGFTDLVQGTVMVPSDMSGNAVGWPQYDGARKRAFLAWCKAAMLDWASDKANYKYFVEEIKTTEKASLAALKRTTTLKEATDVFERTNERPGVVALSSREAYARRAMAAYAAAPKPIAPIYGGGTPCRRSRDSRHAGQAEGPAVNVVAAAEPGQPPQ
jgi:hypothetical protein